MIQQDSTQVTFTEVYQDIKGALAAAGDALKVGSEHVYEIMVRQQMVNSVAITIALTISSILSIYLIRMGFKNLKVDKARTFKDRYGEVRNGTGECVEVILPTAVGCFIGLVTLIAMSLNFQDILTGFLNPEYGAIMDIKDFIK